MRKLLNLVTALALSLSASAQSHNTGMGDSTDFRESLSQRLFKLEKKTDALNIYFNFTGTLQANDYNDGWTTAFRNKEARIEIKGNLTSRLSYRFRQRLNKGYEAQSEDNFAKATDVLMVGYKFSDAFSIQAGKKCQNWGGYEFDEAPTYVYQFSDMCEYMDCYMAGVNFSFKPFQNHEFDLDISNVYSNKFEDEYGADAKATAADGGICRLERASMPLTYILLWKGRLLDGRLLTRWSVGGQTLARHKYDRRLMVGQKLVLPTFQIYFDYMGVFDGLDRQLIASNDGADYLQSIGADYFSDVHYNSWVTKAYWQFAPKCNLVLKGTYETVDVPKVEAFNDYRKAYGYMASMEYYPIPRQDLRLYLAYIGRKYDFSKACGLKDYNSNRIELGFMYYMKVF